MALYRVGANKALVVAGGWWARSEAQSESVRQVEAERVEAGRLGHAHSSLLHQSRGALPLSLTFASAVTLWNYCTSLTLPGEI